MPYIDIRIEVEVTVEDGWEFPQVIKVSQRDTTLKPDLAQFLAQRIAESDNDWEFYNGCVEAIEGVLSEMRV